MEENKRFCTNCGNELPPQSSFCPQCGTPAAMPSEPAVQAAAEQPAVPEPAAEQTSQPTLTPNGMLNNPHAGQDYSTVPYSAGYEVAQPEPKKKKVSKKIVIPVLLGAVLVCAAFGLFRYFTGDEYNYKKALNLYNAGQYEEAYKTFYSLGDYKDSQTFLPFHGHYRHSSDDYGYTYTFFTDGTYKYVIEDEDDGDTTYKGTFTTDGYKTAYLEEEDGEKKTFEVHGRYIYQTNNEETCFDDQIDTATDLFNAVIKEEISDTFNSITLTLKWKYTFEDDGTYELEDKAYSDGEQFGDYPDSGTYELKDGVLTLTSNEDNDKLVWIVDEDGNVYRMVFAKEQ